MFRILCLILLLAASLMAAELQIGRLQYGGGGDWYADPSSIPNWLDEFERRTGLEAAEREVVLRPLDPALRRMPFVYMTGHGQVSFSEEEEKALREWLEGGGFLYADDNYGMDPSFRMAMGRLFPEASLELVPAGHPIYHSWYELVGVPKIHEHDGKPPQGWGVFLDGRLAVFYTHEADIGDGLEDSSIHKNPPEKREAAFRMAVNVLYYALTRNEQ
jgi:hypothetical protein